MRSKRKIKNFAFTLAMCFSIILGKPAHAFVWPTIDITMITSFVSSIHSCLGQVKAAKAQIETYIQTIDAVGDQASSMVKYAMKLKNSLSTIQDKVDGITQSVNPVNPLRQVFDNLEEGSSSLNGEVVETALADINNKIQNSEGGRDIQQILQESQTNVLRQNKQTEQLLSEAQNSVQSFFDNSEKSLDMLVETTIKDGELNEESSAQIQTEKNTVKNGIKNLKTETLNYIASLKDENVNNKELIMTAYNEYEQDIQDYYAGKIDRKQLDTKANAFKENVTKKSAIDANVKDNLLKMAENITVQLDELKESIIDKVANNKDYSDEDIYSKTGSINVSNNKKYVFNYSETHNRIYLKGIYANQEPVNIKGGDKNFIFPRELWGKSGGKCKNLKFEKIKDNVDEFLESYRDCVIRAKTEKDYFCPGDNNCDPYKKEPIFKGFEREGVYKHIVQDYGVANELNIIAIKQEMMSWQQPKEDNPDSTLAKLQHLQESGTSNTLDAYTLQGMIGLENAKLWSRLRRVDALSRAKDVANLYRQQNDLYIDGRDEEFRDAQDSCPGLINENNESKTVLSNVILYVCKKKGEDFSVSYENRGKEGIVKAAEKNIKDCFQTYAKNTSVGEGVDSENMTEWRKKEEKALNDSAFYTLAFATINNYKSSKDFDEKAGEDDPSIITLEEGVNKISTLMDSYNSGVETSYYTTQQILNVVDTDAQSLQTDIIKDLKTMSADFFGEEESN